MATFMPGNKSPRERPWLARMYIKRRPVCLGYFKTKAEAEQVEREARGGDNDGRSLETHTRFPKL